MIDGFDSFTDFLYYSYIESSIFFLMKNYCEI